MSTPSSESLSSRPMPAASIRRRRSLGRIKALFIPRSSEASPVGLTGSVVSASVTSSRGSTDSRSTPSARYIPMSPRGSSESQTVSSIFRSKTFAYGSFALGSAHAGQQHAAADYIGPPSPRPSPGGTNGANGVATRECHSAARPAGSPQIQSYPALHSPPPPPPDQLAAGPTSKGVEFITLPVYPARYRGVGPAAAATAGVAGAGDDGREVVSSANGRSAFAPSIGRSKSMRY
ncbi:hypothetical protein HDU84_002341 [Entophlyctis sp. JEL0112]|nr:hypothetical protein HDU84_002341 [Entophlyctis sp. JEL0112]